MELGEHEVVALGRAPEEVVVLEDDLAHGETHHQGENEEQLLYGVHVEEEEVEV